MARAILPANEAVRLFRTCFLVFNYKNLSEKVSAFHHDLLVQKLREKQEQECFFQHWTIQSSPCDMFGNNAISKACSALIFWCDKCNSVVPVTMPYDFMNQPNPSKRNKCKCIAQRYHIPGLHEIPEPLLGLSTDNIIMLRPFDLDCGVYQRHAHGYKTKTAMLRLHVSPTSVIEKIRNLTNAIDR